MESNVKIKSEERIEKATELLWKVWWFCFYLIIVPSIVALIGFFIFYFFRIPLIISIGFSVLAFMFAVLFLYKSYDKYRKNPFFKNKINNPKARIHILFLITILSLVVTPIFVLVTPEDYSFELLPVISFSLLYNIVYYYFYYQPIDFFSLSEGCFKHSINFKLTFKQSYNLMIIFNFVIQVVFLSYTFYTKLSWLFALITNFTFYMIALLTTKEICKDIKSKIQEEISILESLDKYKQKFSLIIISLIFALLIQMPFVMIILFNLSNIVGAVPQLINASLLSLIFLLIYLKLRGYIIIHFKKFVRAKVMGEISEVNQTEIMNQGKKETLEAPQTYKEEFNRESTNLEIKSTDDKPFVEEIKEADVEIEDILNKILSENKGKAFTINALTNRLSNELLHEINPEEVNGILIKFENEKKIRRTIKDGESYYFS